MTFLTWVGFLFVLIVMGFVGGLMLEWSWKRLDSITRMAFALTVRRRTWKRVRNSIRSARESHAGLKAEIKDIKGQRDRFHVRMNWYHAKLHEAGIYPDHPPEDMTPEQSNALEQAALRKRYGRTDEEDDALLESQGWGLLEGGDDD